MRIIQADELTTLEIARVGEQEATQVRFGTAWWYQTFGAGGSFALEVQRPTDAAPYLVPLTDLGDTVAWTVSATDAAILGRGSCQLRYLLGNTLAKARIWTLRILASLSEPGEEPPEPFESYVDAVHADAVAAETAQAAAELAQGKAEDAQEAAEAAQTAAETAQGKAEDARDAAAAAAASIAKLDAIAVTPPAKRYYASTAETLDLTGMSVTASYTNGASYELLPAFYVSDPAAGSAFDSAGVKTVAVTFRELGVTKTDSFDVSVAAGPIITAQPEDFEGDLGDTAVFMVAAAGNGLKYQWQFSNNGGAWTNSGSSGNKTPTLSVELTAARLLYEYRCVVTDADNLFVASDAAKMVKRAEVVEFE